MTKEEIVEMAIELLATSTSIIIQKTVDSDRFLFKMHKLDFPRVRVSLVFNNKIMRDEEMDVTYGLGALCNAIQVGYSEFK